ncbi:MAG: glycoside hydrolase family 20 [Bacteroidetes bacterium GWF2_42_66]|nr:MAG: glycoside hydrolase family 20 [Bacteroidetes bacterium GWA2_42_15]OFX96950.1 MAG: glycoside hydrolase family 20 [Bacteroidetes bacterium GWE2_42_39]OFY44707.1 MAG: glycoside hydrolase family 20 [Bacteroidetes bacterium GWF2_42_66]HAZ03069.1 glycoside hydrolase family 20 [Marinilabiliales bacterium]HBL75001.1 glycoside hydrolase family 20 [Prolixibacteraceae bacterium]
MKENIVLFLFGLCIFFNACQPTIEKKGDFVLIPSPQQFVTNGPSKIQYTDVINYLITNKVKLPEGCDLSDSIQTIDKHRRVEINFSIDKSLDVKAEGYTLEILKKEIIITGKDSAGLFYAFVTLKQLMEDSKDQDVCLPICNIKDYPLLSYRAIHLDVKHHIDKVDYYYNLIDKLAGYKVNAVIVELEDKIKYERQPEIGSADALSIDEWKKLSDYAWKRNIEISPLVQGLGHASFILKHDKFKNLRDDPQSDWAFNPLDPGTYELQYNLYLDAMEATPHGRFLHVGGDEVHTTARGNGKSPLELQLIWLNKVCQFAEEHGRMPIFWDDMPLKYANVYSPMFNTKLSKQKVDKIWQENEHNLLEFLDQFPKNCIYMRWNYSSPQTFGNSKAMEWFRNNGMQVMGATAGQTRWVLMPQNESNIDNIKTFATTSINNGLNGLFLTLWDDDSPHFELYIRGIIAFAEYTWAGGKRSDEEIKSAYRHREFSYTLSSTEYAFVDQLEKPVAFWKNALLNSDTNRDRNDLPKYINPIEEAIIDLPDKNNKGMWTNKYTTRLEHANSLLKDYNNISSKIAAMKSKAIRNIYVLDVYNQVNELTRFAPKALLTLKAYDLAQNEQQEIDAIKRIKELQKEFTGLRDQFEQVYGETRILTKPESYILDQDHHSHLANQAISFDWQFLAEVLFLEKIKTNYN